MPHTLFQTIPTNPKDVLFWTGAGISIDSPSSLPSGSKLTEDVVKAFCLPDTWEFLTSLLRKAELKDSTDNLKSIPRLEAVLGNIISILGYNVLNRFSLFNPYPNALHYFFAHHIASHGRHITLNLDLGIENAISDIYSNLHYDVITPSKGVCSSSPWILHLHGKHGETPSKLGLTLENITKGISDVTKQIIIKAILDTKTIIFAGYSGSDVFDVNPFFADLIGQQDLSGKYVIWIDYSKDYNSYISYINSGKKLPILEALSRCNAQSYVWTGLTSSFIDEIRDHWGFATHPDNSSLGSVPSFDKNVPEWQKCLVTSKIFISIGIGIKAIKDQKCFVDEYNRYCQGQLHILAQPEHSFWINLNTYSELT